MGRSRWASLLLLTLAACTLRSDYQGPVSDHFDGERFHNAQPFNKGALDLLRFALSREPGVWTRDLGIAPGPRPEPVLAQGALRATVVNHSTVLLQFDGVNLLTDPIWSERASPLQWLGPRRFVPPGLRFEELPRIDAVLISHDHYDHLDLPTLRRLQAAHHPVFLVGLGQGASLRAAGLANIAELDWDQPYSLANGRRVFAAPAVHWTGRAPWGRNRSLWLAFVIETAGGPVYFAGDTGYGPQFAAAYQRYGAMRLALLPIGAYKPRWLTAYQHLDPSEALRAHGELHAAASLGIHYGTFELSDDGQQEPVAELARQRMHLAVSETAFRAAAFGKSYDLPPLKLAE